MLQVELIDSELRLQVMRTLVELILWASSASRRSCPWLHAEHPQGVFLLLGCFVLCIQFAHDVRQDVRFVTKVDGGVWRAQLGCRGCGRSC
jgi:hypothetical protein